MAPQRKKFGEKLVEIKVDGSLQIVVLDKYGKHRILAQPKAKEENKNPNFFWQDIENLLIPKDMDPKNLYDSIVKGLAERNYTREVTILMIFSKTSEHITLESLSKMGNIAQVDLGYYSEIPQKNTADDAIREEIEEFTKVKDGPPQNLIILGSVGASFRLL